MSITDVDFQFSRAHWGVPLRRKIIGFHAEILPQIGQNFLFFFSDTLP
jgi:hypothetical protein